MVKIRMDGHHYIMHPELVVSTLLSFSLNLERLLNLRLIWELLLFGSQLLKATTTYWSI